MTTPADLGIYDPTDPWASPPAEPEAPAANDVEVTASEQAAYSASGAVPASQFVPPIPQDAVDSLVAEPSTAIAGESLQFLNDSATFQNDAGLFSDDLAKIQSLMDSPVNGLLDPVGTLTAVANAPVDGLAMVTDAADEVDDVNQIAGFGMAAGGPSGTGAASVPTSLAPTSATEPPAGYAEGEPEGGSGTISTTVYPDGSSVSSSTEGGVTTVTGSGPAAPPDGFGEADYGDGVYGDPGDGLSDGLSDAGDAASDGGTSLLGDIAGSGVPLAAVGGAAYDLAEGNYDGAIAEGIVGGADIAGDALGLPGFDGDVGVVTDLVDGNTGALVGDAETAAIETGASIAGGAIGSIIGPEGTIVGAAIGNFVGGAIAPSVEDAVSDTIDNAEDLGSDTVDALSDAGSDLSDGNVVGAVGDLAGGAVDDLGDVASEAVDLTGDAIEGVGDVVSATAGLVGDVGEGIEDVASGAEDVASDIGDGIEDLGDDIEDLF